MGTRSAIGIPAGDGWKARYCHWDGYPTGVGAQLYLAVICYGLDKVVEVVTNESVGWSSLPTGDGWLKPPVWGERVSDAGESYSARGETPHSDDPTGDWIYSTDEETPGCEWAYVLSKAGLGVYKGEGGAFGMGGGGRDTWQLLGIIPWHPDEAHAMETLKRMEQGGEDG